MKDLPIPWTATSGADEPMSGPADLLVRIAFLVRLVALGLAALAMVATGGPWPAVATFIGLLLTSHLGLQYPSVRRRVMRHPSLALPDVALVALIPFTAGGTNPLALVSLSSALLVGALFPLRTAVPLASVLAAGQLVTLDDERWWLHAPALDGPVTVLSVTIIGLAFRRASEERMRLAAESAAAREATAAADERLRLARDLHDTVAKSVQGIALQAAALPQWLERDPAVAAAQARTVASGAREALTAARGLLDSLRLDDPRRPLEEALAELLHRWQAQHTNPVVAVLNPVPSLAPSQRQELVLAAAEALENVVRHAARATVRVCLTATHDTVRLTVADDGPGFPPSRMDEAENEGRYGLTGIRERLAAAGGSATIRSVPGEGTTVVLAVPAPSAAHAPGVRRNPMARPA